MDIIKLVGDNMERIRLDKSLSQQNVADRIGIAQSHYSSYESGNKNPTLATLGRISLKGLQCDPVELLLRPEQRELLKLAERIAKLGPRKRAAVEKMLGTERP